MGIVEAHPYIHVFHKYLLSAYCGPGTLRDGATEICRQRKALLSLNKVGKKRGLGVGLTLEDICYLMGEYKKIRPIKEIKKDK